MARRSTPLVSDASARFIEQRFARSGSMGVRYGYVSLLRRFAAAVNDCQVGSLDPDRIEAFFYGPKGLVHSCARSTLGKYRGDLNAFLSWCHRRKWCDSPDYLLGGITDKSTRSSRERLRLSEDALWSLADHAGNPRDRALIVFVMHTAVRISEAQSIRLQDLNLDTGQVKLHIHKTRDEDIVNLGPTLESELREWVTIYSDAETVAPYSYLFPARRVPQLRGRRAVDMGHDPNRPISNPASIIRRIAGDAGVSLEDGDGWHTVRRSVARLFFDRASANGHDAALRMTAALLHHKHAETTERYLGLTYERVKRDDIMQAGFLTRPTGDNVVRLSDRRDGVIG